MKNGWLSYDGVSTANLGSYTTGKDTHNAPERDVTTFQIAGRNGDFFVDNGRYKNITVTYPCFVMGFSLHEQKIRNSFGVPLKKYAVLQDSYDTSHFRLARPVGGITFEPARGDAANFDLSFDCDPRRFLNSGNTATEITGGYDSSLENPTPFTAKPLIELEDVSNGLVFELADSNSGNVYTMTAATSYTGTVVIDCEKQDIYDEATLANKNDLFTLSDGFPEITDGATVTVTITGTYTSAYVTPRWWEL